MRLRFCCFLSLLASSLYAQTVPVAPAPTPSAPPDKFLLRSGQVTMCKPDHGCTEETQGGRKYLLMTSDGFVLKVSSGLDHRLGYADISITNQTTAPQQVDPANFRMEESEPRLRRLFYVDPNRQQAPTAREPKEAKSNVGKGLPPPWYWESQEHEEDRKAKAVAVPQSNIATFHAALIAPDGSVSGRVYFERPRTTAGVSLLLALPGALFEFPCQFDGDPKARKRHKRDAVAREDDTR